VKMEHRILTRARRGAREPRESRVEGLSAR
jgi:hypothetical protein